MMDAKKSKAIELTLLKFGVWFAVCVILGFIGLIAFLIWATSGGGTP